MHVVCIVMHTTLEQQSVFFHAQYTYNNTAYIVIINHVMHEYIILVHVYVSVSTCLLIFSLHCVWSFCLILLLYVALQCMHGESDINRSNILMWFLCK